MYTGCVLYVAKVSIDHEILRTYRQTHKIFRRCKQFFFITVHLFKLSTDFCFIMLLKTFQKVQDMRRELEITMYSVWQKPDEHNRVCEMKNMIKKTLWM